MQEFDVLPSQINQWRDQRLEGATGVFGDVPEGEPEPSGDVKPFDHAGCDSYPLRILTPSAGRSALIDNSRGKNMNGLYLSGWIRGVTEGELDDAAANSVATALGERLGQELGREVKMFYFEKGASLVVEGLKGVEVLNTANAIAYHVSRIFHRTAFYHTCSFGVSPLEQDIPDSIRSAKKMIDHHAEYGGSFIIDGRLLRISPERWFG